MAKCALLRRFTNRILFGVLFIGTVRSAAAQADAKAPSFPIPKQMVALSEAVTPREYAEIVAAIKGIAEQPMVSQELDQGPGLGDLNLISATRVPLGSLGDGMLIEFHEGCGTGGCPVWLLVRDGQSYKRAFAGGAWGFSLQSSGSSVPDIALYWQMSASETDVSQYHYAGGKFMPVKAKPDKCMGVDDKRGACAGIDSAPWQQSTITPAEYEDLWQGIQKLGKPAPSRQEFETGTHAFRFQLISDAMVVVFGSGDCTPAKNCTISLYGCHATYIEGNIPQCEYWDMLRDVQGWGVANVSDWQTDPFSPRAAFVVSRSISLSEIELTRYSVTTKSNGPKAGTRLTSEVCEVVSPKAGKWPGHWNSTALVISKEPCR